MSMERLWAPWRMSFIRNVDDVEGCFLCRAAAGSEDREKLVLEMVSRIKQRKIRGVLRIAGGDLNSDFIKELIFRKWKII